MRAAASRTAHKPCLLHNMDDWRYNYFGDKARTFRVTDKLLRAIDDNAHVQAALAAVNTPASADSGGAPYKPITLLLNRISRVFFEANHPQFTIIFACNNDSESPPHYSSFAGTVAELDEAMTFENAPTQPWAALVSVGEHQRDEEAILDPDQLETTITTLKRYRPDLPTVYGFQVAAAYVQLASINPSGVWSSADTLVSNIQPWIALVAYNYHAVDKRLVGLQHCSSQIDFHRWDVSYGGSPFAAVPFHVGRAPGRATFAAFELAPASASNQETTKAFFEGEAAGFFKISWQDSKARATGESELLEHLHREAWLPGLVRPRHTERLSRKRISLFGDDARVPYQCAPEIIHLGSIGEPLSQAISMRHLLYAFYDVVETHLHMCEKNVLHCDMSWFNILIFPHHTVVDERPEAARPCISRIMQAAGVQVSANASPRTALLGRRIEARHGEDAFEPCALITDLDHSTKIDALRARDKKSGPMRTGTAMFIPVEMVDENCVQHDGYWCAPVLLDAMREVETTDAGRAAFKAAFPNGDGDFMSKFEAVAEKETARRRAAFLSEDYPLDVHNPNPSHEGRHDCESMWWAFLWGFIRARPLSRELDDPNPRREDTAAFNAFCEAMLTHDPDRKMTEWNRSRYLGRSLCPALCHPHFAPLHQLFRHMSMYLTIPWHLYAGHLDLAPADDHAHVAFRRLLLAYLVRDDLAELLDTPLDTEQPRVTTAVRDNEWTLAPIPTQQRAVSEGTTAGKTRGPRSTTAAGSNSPAPQHDAPADACGPPATRGARKRAREDLERGAGGDEPATKKVKVVDDTGDDAAEAGGKGVPTATAHSASTVQEYRADIHAQSRSVNALRLKVWKDKFWFGTGLRKPAAKYVPRERRIL